MLLCNRLTGNCQKYLIPCMTTKINVYWVKMFLKMHLYLYNVHVTNIIHIHNYLNNVTLTIQ